MVRTDMKKFIGSIKRNSTVARSKSNDRRNGAAFDPQSLPQGDYPEAVVVREAVAFCEAGAPGSPSAGDEYLHLPAIVDNTESSPAAAREVAVTLQRYLSKQNFERGYAQYNAVMLLRILTDNPGYAFTQNFDKNFVANIKNLLRECRDSSVQQIMRETLDYFEAEKLNANDSLMPLVEMWRKEKGGAARMYSSSVGIDGTAVITHDFAHNDQARSHSHPYGHQQRRDARPPRALPAPDELAARIEEAKTSARLLVQMVQSTPPGEFIGNELIREFVERAKQASKSVQQYMACENPAPDENTMLTLIETSEQLNIAMSKHQRALLAARRATGQASTGASPQPQPGQQDPFSTTAMQNALPSQSPRQEQPQYPPTLPPVQHQQYSRYNESDDLYNSAAATVSPIEPRQEAFDPPSGPPPVRRPAPSNDYPHAQAHTYSSQTYAPTPGSPTRDVAAGHTRQESATKAYEVPENPFADDHRYEAPSGPPPSQSNPHSIFNRAAGQLRDPASPTQASNRPATAELESSAYPVPPPQPDREGQPRPGIHGYNSGWQPTPSFVHRQESSEAHVTMSGASPSSSPVRK